MGIKLLLVIVLLLHSVLFMYGRSRNVRKMICSHCRGTGRVFKTDVFNWGEKPCAVCGGTGEVVVPVIPDRPISRNNLGI